jgi:hypothetical protein
MKFITKSKLNDFKKIDLLFFVNSFLYQLFLNITEMELQISVLKTKL